MKSIQAGTLALVTCMAVPLARAEASPSGRTWLQGSPRTAHHQSTIGTQIILDRIHHAAIPKDPWKPDERFPISPTSAYIYQSSIGFRTSCSDPYVSTYRYYLLSEAGLKFQTCGPLAAGQRQARPNEFRRSLNSLSRRVEKAVGVTSNAEVRSIRGTRKSVTAYYAHSPSSKTEALEKITITKSKKATIVYS